MQRSHSVVGAPIMVGMGPAGIAVTPDGSKVYVANSGSDSVSVIDTATNMTIGAPIAVGLFPNDLGVTKDGTKVYVSNTTSGSVSVIDVATDTVLGLPIVVGMSPNGIAFTSDRAYVLNSSDFTYSIIDIATDTVIGPAIPAGLSPFDIAITADETLAYLSNTVGPLVADFIDLGTNMIVGTILGPISFGIAITNDQQKIFATNFGVDTVSFFNRGEMTVAGTIMGPFSMPFGIAMCPEQPKAVTINGSCEKDIFLSQFSLSNLVVFNKNSWSNFERESSLKSSTAGYTSPSVLIQYE